jgi:hypothetical protein
VNRVSIRNANDTVPTRQRAIRTKLKWMQRWDFPGGHPSQYYSSPEAISEILMGSGVVALVRPRQDECMYHRASFVVHNIITVKV